MVKVTGVGKIQEYTGVECKKEILVEEGEQGNEEEEKGEDMDDIFFRVKQKNLHVLGGFHGNSIIFHRYNRRWRVE